MPLYADLWGRGSVLTSEGAAFTRNFAVWSVIRSIMPPWHSTLATYTCMYSHIWQQEGSNFIPNCGLVYLYQRKCSSRLSVKTWSHTLNKFLGWSGHPALMYCVKIIIYTATWRNSAEMLQPMRTCHSNFRLLVELQWQSSSFTKKNSGWVCGHVFDL